MSPQKSKLYQQFEKWLLDLSNDFKAQQYLIWTTLFSVFLVIFVYMLLFVDSSRRPSDDFCKIFSFISVIGMLVAYLLHKT